MIDPVVQAGLRAGLALLLAAAAVHKLRDRTAFRAALADYRVLPAAVTAPAVLVVPACELALAAALLVPGSGAGPAVATAGLLALYTAAIALNLARGRRTVACGCGGPAGDQNLSAGLVLRNAVLVLAALAAALPASARALAWPDAVTLLGGIALLALLYTGVDIALANASRLRALRSPA